MYKIRGIWWGNQIGGSTVTVAIIMLPLNNGKLLINNQNGRLTNNIAQYQRSFSEIKIEKNTQKILYVFDIILPSSTSYLTVEYEKYIIRLDHISGNSIDEIINILDNEADKKKLKINISDITGGYVWVMKKAIEQIDGIIANISRK